MRFSLIALALIALSQQGCAQRTRVPSEQQANRQADRQAATQQEQPQKRPATQIAAAAPIAISIGEGPQPTDSTRANDDEFREYWPFLVFSRRLKVTDSLLALFTLLLIAVGWKTLSQMQRSEERQLRAYLGVSFRWNDGIVDRNHGVYYDELRKPFTAIYVSNHGQTPAGGVKLTGECRMLADETAEQEVSKALLRPDDDPNHKAPRMCHPRANEGLPLFYHLRSKESSQPADPSKATHLFAYGRIDYTDAFKKERRTIFCAFCDPNSITGSVWMNSPYHNSAD